MEDNNKPQFSNDELMDALRYALQLIDDVSRIAKTSLDLVSPPQLDPETGMPNSAVSAAKSLHRADLRGLAVHGPSNAGALRAIVAGEPKTPWFDPVRDIRTRLARGIGK